MLLNLASTTCFTGYSATHLLRCSALLTRLTCICLHCWSMKGTVRSITSLLHMPCATQLFVLLVSGAYTNKLPQATSGMHHSRYTLVTNNHCTCQGSGLLKGRLACPRSALLPQAPPGQTAVPSEVAVRTPCPCPGQGCLRGHGSQSPGPFLLDPLLGPCIPRILKVHAFLVILKVGRECLGQIKTGLQIASYPCIITSQRKVEASGS